MIYLPQRLMALFLLIILGGNFFLSLFWYHWHVSPPLHDHIILGPIVPGWEDHHEHRKGPEREWPSPSQSKLKSFLAATSPLATEMDSNVVSLYGSPAGDDTIFSFGVQLLWLAEWLLSPERSSLTWPLKVAFPTLASAFLAPLDKPPSASPVSLKTLFILDTVTNLTFDSLNRTQIFTDSRR